MNEEDRKLILGLSRNVGELAEIIKKERKQDPEHKIEIKNVKTPSLVSPLSPLTTPVRGPVSIQVLEITFNYRESTDQHENMRLVDAAMRDLAPVLNKHRILRLNISYDPNNKIQPPAT